MLAAGSTISGFLAYVFFALSTRTLGADAAAPVSVLWTYWSFSAAALTFPLQHWIAQSVAAHGGEGTVRDAIRRVTGWVVVAAAVVGMLAWLSRNQLFHRDDVWFPLLVVVVTMGSGFVGVVRGSLSARLRFTSVAVALVTENAVRCLAATVLILAGVHSSLAFGACLAFGALAGFLWPSALRFSKQQAKAATDSAMRFITGAAGGQLIGQAVLTGGPVALALSGGSPAQVTALFAGLALFRAPYTIAIGLVSALTGRLTHLVVEGQTRALRLFRLGTWAATAFTLVAAAGIGAGLGPWLLRLIFGDDVRLDRFASLLIAVGSTVALANLVVTVSILAHGRSGVIARSWVVGAISGAAVLVFAGTDDKLIETCWAFVVAEAVAFVVLAGEDYRSGTALGRSRSTSAAVSADAKRPRPSSA